MDGQFITNKDLILSDIINSILPKCDNAYFLVGYFYFSGFAELCEKLKNVNLKVLVGLEVERNIINGIKEVENFTSSNKSRGQLREDFYKGFVDIYNNTDFFDSEEQIFDAGLKLQYQKDDFQILIATDAISEGYNLHRAGTIFNYDIPYNPTRVIQRIGRINRINKKMFDKLYIYNYFPTDIGEVETRTKQISTLKMAMIHAIMGEDTKALTDEEELNAFFKERYQAELAKSEERSWDTKYRNLLNKVKGTEIHSTALRIPHRARIAREVEKTCKGIILFGKKGNDFVFKIGMNDTDIPLMLTSEQALNLFEATAEEKPVAVDKQFDQVYQHIKSHLYRSLAKDENEKSRLEAFGYSG